MQKLLNPDLFGSEMAPPTPAGVGFEHILSIDQKIAELRGQMHELRDGVQYLKSEMQVMQKGFQGQFDQVARALKVLEQNDQTLASQNQQKNNLMAQKVADHKNVEAKIKEMMDRHQMILRGYDLKIQQLQAVLAEKENTLLSFQGALHDAKAEIARLKRA